MATLPQPTGTRCLYDKGNCQCEKMTDNGWCDEHANETCCSCGAHATHGCDAGIGGLCCGAPLCAGCTGVSMPKKGHAHITKERALWLSSQEEKEEEERIASRKSPVQRKDAEGNPLNLFELLKNPDGFVIKELYYLELQHGLMGFFPALYKAADAEKDVRGEIILAADKRLLKEIWQKLDRRPSKVGQIVGYVGNGVVYPGTGSTKADIGDQEECKSILLMDRQLFDRLSAEETEENPAFHWAFGLMSSRANLDEGEFIRMIEQA